MFDPFNVELTPSWYWRLFLWCRGMLMARPEFLGTQQRASEPGTAHWFALIRLERLSLLGTLRDCRVRLVPMGYEAPGAGVLSREHPAWKRPLDLRWQDDVGNESREERSLHKHETYCVPVALRKLAHDNHGAETHLTTNRYFQRQENPLTERGTYFFKIQLISGGKRPWLSRDYYAIQIPADEHDNGHFNVESWYAEQFVRRFGSNGEA